MRKLWFILALLCVAASARAQNSQGPTFSWGGNITTSNASCVITACVRIDLPGTANIMTMGVTGTWSGTIAVEESQDNGVTWTSAGTSITSNGTTTYSVAAFTNFRARASAFVSGNAGVNFNVSVPGGGGSGGGAGGSVTSITATAPIVVTPSPLITTGVASCPTCATSAGSETSGNVVTGAGGKAIQDSGVALASLQTTANVASGCQAGCSYTLTTSDQIFAAGGTGSALTANNQGAFIRFYNNAQRKIASACFDIATASAGGNIDVGVYSLSGTTGTLIWHTGAKSTTATGAVCGTATTATLSAGQNYYIGWIADNTTVVLKCVANAGDLPTLLGGSGATANTYGLDATDTGTGGVLPNTITTTNIVNNNAKVLLPWVQVFN